MSRASLLSQQPNHLSHGEYENHLLRRQSDFHALKGLNDTATTNISPLGLGVNLQPVNVCSRYWPALKHEMSLLNGQFRRRPITLMNIEDGFPSTDQAILCELIFTLGHHFNLNHLGNRVYCYSAPLSAFDDNRLALIKGLGFNRVEIRSDGTEMDHHFIEAANLFKLYQMAHGSIYFTDELPDKHRLATIDKSVFDKLCFKAPLNNQLINLLGHYHYHRIDSQTWCQQQHPLYRSKCHKRLRVTAQGVNANNVCDWLGLGANTKSQMDTSYWQNQPLKDYSQMTLHYQQSIAWGQELSEQQKLIEHVLNQLSCYGQADLEYFLARYELDLREHLPGALAALNISDWQFEDEELILYTPANQAIIAKLGLELDKRLNHSQ